MASINLSAFTYSERNSPSVDTKVGPQSLIFVVVPIARDLVKRSANARSGRNFYQKNNGLN
jgi:hypothetical protein